MNMIINAESVPLILEELLIHLAVIGLILQIWRQALILERANQYDVAILTTCAACIIKWHNRKEYWFHLAAVTLLALMKPFCRKQSPYMRAFPKNASTIEQRQCDSTMMLSCLSYLVPSVLALYTGHSIYAFSLLGNTVAAWQYHISRETQYYNLDNIFATFTMLLAVYTTWLACPDDLIFAPNRHNTECKPCPEYCFLMLIGVPFAGAVLGATGDNAFLLFYLNNYQKPLTSASATSGGTGTDLWPAEIDPNADKSAFVNALMWLVRTFTCPTTGSDSSSSGTFADADSRMPNTISFSKSSKKTTVQSATSASRAISTSTYLSMELPSTGCVLWSCPCIRISNSHYELLHPWWHVASIIGPLLSILYLNNYCGSAIDAYVDGNACSVGSSFATDTGLGANSFTIELDLKYIGIDVDHRLYTHIPTVHVPLNALACIIFLCCIIGVIVENATGSKPPM